MKNVGNGLSSLKCKVFDVGGLAKTIQRPSPSLDEQIKGFSETVLGTGATVEGEEESSPPSPSQHAGGPVVGKLMM